MDADKIIVALAQLPLEKLKEISRLASLMVAARERSAPVDTDGAPEEDAGEVANGSTGQSIADRLRVIAGSRAPRGHVPKIIGDIVRASPGLSGAEITKRALKTYPELKRSSVHPTLGRLVEAGDIRRVGESHDTKFYPTKRGG